MQSTGGGFGLRDGIIATAEAIGADPLDLATAISYETAGTFDPTKAGPTTQWGQHRGLIQFGEPQAEQYGVDFSNSDAALASQLGPEGAIAKYFTGSGFQPGMSGLDLYSTINAGAPGKYNASDANNGGAPGSVADKWNNQMSDHRTKAAQLLGGSYTQAQASQGGAQPQDNSGVIQALTGAMSEPWVAKKYGPVLEALMGQQMKRGDMQYQQQLQQGDPMYQAQLAKLTAPAEVDPWAGTQVINGQLVSMGANGPQVVGDYRTQGVEGEDRYRPVGGQIWDFAPEDGGAPRLVGGGTEEVVMGPDGQPIFIRGATGTTKRLTETQAKDNVFRTRAEGALRALEEGGSDSLTSRRDNVLDALPLGIGREAQSEDYQVAQNQGNEFLQAILRKDTGAAITEQEQKLYGDTYLPRPGDGAAVLEVKKQARARAVEALSTGMTPEQIATTERALVNAARRADGTTEQSAPVGAAPDFSAMSDEDLDAYIQRGGN